MNKRKLTNGFTDEWLCKKFKIKPCSVILKSCNLATQNLQKSSPPKSTKVFNNRSRQNHNKSTKDPPPVLINGKKKVCKIRYLPDELFLEKLKNDLKDIPLDELSVAEIVERTPEEYRKEADVSKVAQKYLEDRLKAEAEEFLLERLNRKFNNVPVEKLRVEDIIKKTPQEYKKNTNVVKIVQTYIAERLKQKAIEKNLCLIFFKYATNRNVSLYEEPNDMHILVDNKVRHTVVRAMVKQPIVVAKKLEYSVYDHHIRKKTSAFTDLYSKRKETADKLRSQKSIVKRRKLATHRLSQIPEKSVKKSLKDLVTIPYGAGETILVDKSISHKVKEILATSWKVTLEKSKARTISVMTKNNLAEMLPVHDKEQNANVSQEEKINDIVFATEKIPILSGSRSDDQSIPVEDKDVDQEENGHAGGNITVESNTFAAGKLTSIFDNKSEGLCIPVEEEEIVYLSEEENICNAEKSIVHTCTQNILIATDEPVIISDGFTEERVANFTEEEYRILREARKSEDVIIPPEEKEVYGSEGEKAASISDGRSHCLSIPVSENQQVYESQEEINRSTSEESNVVENLIFASKKLAITSEHGPSIPFEEVDYLIEEQEISNTKIIDAVTLAQEKAPSISVESSNGLIVPFEKIQPVVFLSHEENSIASNDFQAENYIAFGTEIAAFSGDVSDEHVSAQGVNEAEKTPSISGGSSNDLSVPVEKIEQAVFVGHDKNSIAEKNNDFHAENCIAFGAQISDDISDKYVTYQNADVTERVLSISIGSSHGLSVPVEKKGQAVFGSLEDSSSAENSNDFHPENSIAFATVCISDVSDDDESAQDSDDDDTPKLTPFSCARDVMDRDSNHKFGNCYGGLLIEGNIF